MKANSPAPAVSAIHFLTNFIEGWNRFWFTPADPTVLGFIRICAGLVVLYVHLAYTVDLYEFQGPYGWADLKSINDFRQNTPWVPRPSGWEEAGMMPPVTGQDAAEAAYIRKWGANPRQTLATGYAAWSIWFHVTDPAWAGVVHGAVLVIMVLFVIGFCTRITSVLTWLAALSYIQRSPISLFGMDTIFNVLLLYLMIGPSGAALSVDRLIMRYWTTWRILRKRHRHSARSSAYAALHLEDEPGLRGPAPRVSANLAIRLMQIHVCIIYLASGLSKLQGQAWWNGTAIWGTMANPEFSPIYFPGYLWLLDFLCQRRWLWELVLCGGALFTLAFEVSFAFVIWYRHLRWVMLVGAIMLHTGIALFMGLNCFSLCMICLVMSFVPPEALHRLLEMLRGAPTETTLTFHGRIRSQARAASVIHALDIWNQVRLADGLGTLSNRHGTSSSAGGTSIQALRPAPLPEPTGEAAQGLQLVSPAGEVWTGYPLFIKLTRSIQLLKPLGLLASLPGIRDVGKAWFPGTEGDAISPFPSLTQRGRVSETVIS